MNLSLMIRIILIFNHDNNDPYFQIVIITLIRIMSEEDSNFEQSIELPALIENSLLKVSYLFI